MDPTLARPGAPQWAPRPSPPPAVRRPSTAGYWIAALVAVIAVGGGVVALLIGLTGVGHRLENFVNTPVPGSVTVRVDEPTTFVVFSETSGSEPVEDGSSITVTGPDGNPVPLQPYAGDVTWEGEPGTVSSAVAEFHATTTGTYTVTVRGRAPGTQIVVVEDLPVIRAVLLPVVVAGAGLLIAIITLIVTATRRSAAARDAVLARSYWYRQ
jgi:hypothetical protein